MCSFASLPPPPSSRRTSSPYRGRFSSHRILLLSTCQSKLQFLLAERVGFEPTSRDYREPLFESGALSQLGNLSNSLSYDFNSYLNTYNSFFQLSLERVGCARSLRSLRLPPVAEPTSRDYREPLFESDALSQIWQPLQSSSLEF